jgi:zinc protease
MRIVIARVRRVPLVTLQAVIDAGAVRESVLQAGVSQLTAYALAEGTTRLSGDQLSERFERLGGALEPYVGWDELHLTTTVMSACLNEALDLLTDVITAPAFRARDFDRLREERLSELLQRQAEPRGLADDTLERAIFSSASREHLPLGGVEATVERLTIDDAASFHRKMVTPAATTLIVVGDVEDADVLAGVHRTFGSWSAHSAPSATTTPSAAGGPMVHIVAKPDAVQTELRIGHAGPPRDHADYFSLVVMNAVLGGLFNSRINLNLREEHGYTYGAFSSFDWRRQDSIFGVSTAVRSDVSGQAAEEILAEIMRIRREPISPDELSLALQYLHGVFPIRFETTEAIAHALASLVTFGLPDDYFDIYRDAIQRVDIASVQNVAQVHLAPERLRIVAIGDPTILQAQLQPLGNGDVILYDASGAVTG